MKVTLFSRRFNLSLKVAIRKGSETDFLEVLGSPRENAALSRILDDVTYFRMGFEPLYISKYTAKRIDSFFGDDVTNYFNRLEYANR